MKRPMTNLAPCVKCMLPKFVLRYLMRLYKSMVDMDLSKDFPVEKFLRDSKLCTIGEGTTNSKISNS